MVKANLELTEKNLMLNFWGYLTFLYCLKKWKFISGSTRTELFKECTCLMGGVYAEKAREGKNLSDI